MKRSILILFILFLAEQLVAQDHEHSNSLSYSFEDVKSTGVLYIDNINGSITATGYDGNKIMVDVNRTIRAKTDALLQRGMKETSVGIIERKDSILLYTDSGCGKFENIKGRYRYDHCNCNLDYNFQLDFDVKIPKGMSVFLSTVNEGHIEVDNVEGTLEVRNINGGITLTGIQKATHAHTINGDVNLSYDKLPKDPSTYYTLNGDINATYPNGFNASMTFKSFNGEFYTNVDQISKDMVLEKTVSNKKGVNIKLENRWVISTGSGGVNLDFETFNGNVYVKELK